MSKLHCLRVILLTCTAGLFSGSTDAAEFAAAIGHKGFGRCHMDFCSFFIIDTAVPIGSGSDGTLYAVSQQGWGAEYKDGAYDRPPIRIEKPTRSISLVYCSKTRPTVFGFDDGKWQSTSLRPGDDTAIFGANESAYQYYFAACHDAIVRDANPKGLAARLGYHFKAGDGEPGDEDINISPVDLLTSKGSSEAQQYAPSATDMQNCAKIVKPRERLMCFDVLSGHSE